MKTYNTPRMGSYKAGADLSAKQYTFVKAGTNAGEVVAVSATTDVPIGILMNAPLSGEAADVALPGGGAKLKCDASVTNGGLIKTGDDGLGEAASADGALVCARADVTGKTTAANDVIPVEVCLFSLSVPA